MSSAADCATFQPASDQSLMVYFGHQITRDPHLHVMRLLRMLESQQLPGIRNLHPAHCSLLIKFDPLRYVHNEIESIVQSQLARLDEITLPPPREFEIPVCYGEEFGPDLAEVAEMHTLSAADVIEMHSCVTYEVFFLGFVPGFAYLGELPEALVTPRLPTPRKNVPAGSVAIAARQTAVYPFPTPGGWRLLGRTPLQMFDPARTGMSLLTIGDRVQFVPISRRQFFSIGES